MNFEHTYVFNRRTYVLASTADGWEVLYKSPDTAPVRQPFDTYETARAAYWRRLACAVLLSSRRLRSADINGTLVALATDHDGRTHLACHGALGPDHVAPYTDRVTALIAWRDLCWNLVSHASRSGPLPGDTARAETVAALLG